MKKDEFSISKGSNAYILMGIIVLISAILISGCGGTKSTTESQGMGDITGAAVADTSSLDEPEEEEEQEMKPEVITATDSTDEPDKAWPTGATSTQLKFQPMQCEDTPWDEWLRKGEVRFTEVPSDEDLIITYYAFAYGVDLGDIEKMDNDVYCDDCNDCPQKQYILVKAHNEDVQKLVDIGWEIQ